MPKLTPAQWRALMQFLNISVRGVVTEAADPRVWRTLERKQLVCQQPDGWRYLTDKGRDALRDYPPAKHYRLLSTIIARAQCYDRESLIEWLFDQRDRVLED